MLVGNTGQGGRGTRSLSGGYLTLAQQFTTGGHAAGYALTGVSAVLGAGRTLTAEELSKVRAQLWSNSGLDPGEKLADLAVPPPAAAAVRAFATHLAAPPGTRLAANTRYQLVFYAVGGQDQLALDVTSSGNEDAGSASGWSIANRYVGWSGEAAAGSPTVALTSAVVQAVGAPVASDASLAGLTAAAAACADCPYEALALSPAFDSATTAYMARAGYALSHVRLRPTAADASATVRVGRGGSLAPVRSGAEGAAVALDDGWNRLVAEVTAGDGSATTTYTVTVTRATRAGASEPRNVAVTPQDGRLDVSWQAPADLRGGTLQRYVLAHKEVSAPDTDATGSDPSTGWVEHFWAATATSASITGLTNGTWYDVVLSARTNLGDGTPVALEAAPFPAPTNFGLTSTAGSFTVTWTKVADAERYEVAFDLGGRALADLRHIVAVDDGDAESLTISDANSPVPVEADTIYHAYVRACNDASPRVCGRYVGGTRFRTRAAAPTDLVVTPRYRALRVTWTKPPGVVTGYDVHYTSAPRTGMGSVADGDAASGNDPAMAWVAKTRTGTTPSQVLDGLDNGTAYRVRVRGGSGIGNGAFAFGTGTPAGKAYALSPHTWELIAGSSERGDVTLSEAAPQGGLTLAIAALFGSEVPDGFCDDGEDLAEAGDVASLATSVTVAAGQTEASFDIALAANRDLLLGGDGKCFAVRLSTDAADWVPHNAVGEWTISAPGRARFAFGDSATSSARYTASVAEDVTGGTLSVPVTVGYLPNEAVTIAVEVVAAGTTATEYADAANPGDFRIATKSVAFGPTDSSRTQNLSIAITDDTVPEVPETIALRFPDRTGTAADYVDPNEATITIVDDEPTTMWFAEADPVRRMYEGGTETVEVLLRPPTATATTAGVRLRAGGGAATDPADVTLSPRTLAFAAGQSRATFEVAAVADRLTEGSEFFELELVPASGTPPYTVATDGGVARFLLHDTSRDGAAALTIGVVERVPESAGSLDVSFLLGDPAPTGGTVVTLSASGDSTATSGSDYTANPPYTATIAQGERVATLTDVLTIVDDTVDDNGETVVLSASSTNPSLTAPDVTVTIVDNDGVPDAVGELRVTVGAARLDLAWLAPPGALTGYDVHYTTALATGSDAVADDAAASGSDASAAWVDASHSGRTPRTRSPASPTAPPTGCACAP